MGIVACRKALPKVQNLLILLEQAIQTYEQVLNLDDLETNIVLK